MEPSVTAEQLAEALPAKLLRAHRVQVFDRKGEIPWLASGDTASGRRYSPMS
ncbi:MULTISPECIES: hypothetical protein [unclassified Micromonospora]|uniref:hypothetical protein n=1 Tax=unclassified Micromonospora TaxID=2617518 RepID=UPI003A84E500